MNKKYKFTGETIQHEGITLHRIQALRTFGNVKEGDLGGWIEKESNLSHEGDCWVGDDALVYGDALVCEDARVYESAQVFHRACVYGKVRVYGHARVYGDAKVYEGAKVYENAQVYGDARVFGKAQVYGHARVYKKAQIYERARVFGNAWVYDSACVYGDAKVYRGMLGGDDAVSGNKLAFNKEYKPFIENLPEELNALPDGVEEVVFKGVKYKKVLITITKWEKV